MREEDIAYSDIDFLVRNLRNKNVRTKTVFCQVYHDLVWLQLAFTKDKKTILGNENRILNLTEDIEYVEKVYKKLYWRSYYLFLFHFIYLDYTAKALLKHEKALVKDIDSKLEKDSEQYFKFIKEYAIFGENRDAVFQEDYSLFRANYYLLATYKSFVDAKKEYRALNKKGSNFNELLDIYVLEKHLEIRKEEMVDKNKIMMMYLTYNDNPNKSEEDRTSVYQTTITKDQLDFGPFSHKRARFIVSNFYQMKHYNSRLTIKEFLETEAGESVGRGTFLTYKKFYDQRYGKNTWDKTAAEKAYVKYAAELENNPFLKIDASLAKRLNVSQKALRSQIEKERRRV